MTRSILSPAMLLAAILFTAVFADDIAANSMTAINMEEKDALPIMRENCSESFTVSNGRVLSGQTNIGSVRSIACNDGFGLQGRGFIVCQDNGTWSESGKCVSTANSVQTTPPRTTVTMMRTTRTATTRRPLECMEFKCKNGKCIDKAWVCDRDNDCDDNSDEFNCTYTTTTTTTTTTTSTTTTTVPCSGFRCRNGKCVPRSYVCDRDNDCGDRSDEENCGGSTSTTTTAPNSCISGFTCRNGKCIPRSYVCDRDNDCGDRSDEENCGNYNYITTTMRFFNTTGLPSANSTCPQVTCRNGKCVQRTDLCDGWNDCGDRSDEENCGNSITTTMRFFNTTRLPSANSNCPQVTCRSGKCILRTDLCDGWNDCGDRSDEENCGRATTSPPVIFGSTTVTPSRNGVCPEFTCNNGKCIYNRWKCDRDNDCGDNSDEINCPGTPGSSSGNADLQRQLGNAARLDNADQVLQILQRRSPSGSSLIDINWRDPSQYEACGSILANATALHRAAQCNASERIIQALVDNGALVEIKESYWGATPLMYAAISGDAAGVRILLASGASTGTVDKNGRIAIMWAAAAGKSSIIDMLISRGSPFIYAQDNAGWTALMHAAAKGNTDTVKILIVKGADVNIKDNDLRRTALMLAARNGFLPIVQSLVQAGAAINDKTTDGSTALMLAASNYQNEVARYLISQGASRAGCYYSVCT